MSGINTIASFQKSYELRRLVAEQSANMNKASMELSTGLKQDVYGEGIGASGDALFFRASQKANEAYMQSNGVLSGRLATMSDAVGNIRETALDFTNFLIAGNLSDTNRDVVQTQAQAALTNIVNRLNSTYAGSYLFSGEATDRAAYDLDAAFNLTYTGGTAGNLSATIEDGITVEYGKKGDFSGFTAVLTALQTMATTNLDALSDAAFATLRDTIVVGITDGVEELTAYQANLGDRQALVERTVTRQEGLANLYNESILDIEGVDASEAAVRLNEITNQLEATYTVTSKMSQMSILNYL